MKVAVFLHLFYTDLIPEVVDYLSNIPIDYDLIVNTPDVLDEKDMTKIELFVNKFSGKLLISENKGLDVGGYLNIINYVIENNLEYDLTLFAHTKKHARTDPALGKRWRRELLNSILGSKDRAKYILNIFEEDKSIGMIGADQYLIYMSEDSLNQEYIDHYTKKLNLEENDGLEFIGGSIFWARWQPFKEVFSKSRIETSEFEDNEIYKNDGMKAHAIERIFGRIITNCGYGILGIDSQTGVLEPENNIWYQHQNKFLEKYIELKCDLRVNGNVLPAISIRDNLVYDVFELLNIILDRQFGIKAKREIKIKDLCLIKTKASIKYISDDHKEQFENNSLFPEYTKYSDEFKAGATPSATYLLHPSVLKFMTNLTFPNNLYQLDGMRRIMSAINAGIKEIDAYILIKRNSLKNYMYADTIKILKETKAKSTWFPNYQEIIEFDIRGDRTYRPRYTEIYDFSVMKDQIVVDFGSNLGQASLEAYFQGAKKIYNFDNQRAAIESANIMSQVLGANIVNNIVDFNKSTFEQDILNVVKVWDWAIFQAIYRTEEIKNIEPIFDFVVDNTKRGIIFEGHTDPKIDTDEFYRNIFEKYNFKEIEYLGHSNGRPAYLLLKKDEWEDWGTEEFIMQISEPSTEEVSNE